MARSPRSDPRAIRPLTCKVVKRPRATDLSDVLDVSLATGARSGEVLDIRWKNIDLQVNSPPITIPGTVVMARGRGAYRQDHPKTKAGFSTMKVPPFAAQTLKRRHAAELPQPEDLFFPPRQELSL